MSPNGWPGGDRVTERTAPLGIVDRIGRTLRDPRGAVRLEIAHASEARLFFYAFMASVFATLTALGEQALNPQPGPAADPAQWTATQAAAGAFFRPLALYGVAGVIGLAARRLGGTGSWRATRAAVFWTAFAAAPFALILSMLGAVLGAATALGTAAPMAAHALGSLLWAALLAPALGEAHALTAARGAVALLVAVAAALFGIGLLAALLAIAL